MEGAGGPGSEGAGIIPRTFGQVFDAIEHSGGGAQFLVRASFLEVYNEQIRDLLSKVRQSSSCVMFLGWPPWRRAPQAIE